MIMGYLDWGQNGRIGLWTWEQGGMGMGLGERYGFELIEWNFIGNVWEISGIDIDIMG